MRHSITLFKEKMLLLSEPAPCRKEQGVCSVCSGDAPPRLCNPVLGEPHKSVALSVRGSLWKHSIKPALPPRLPLYVSLSRLNRKCMIG